MTTLVLRIASLVETAYTGLSANRAMSTAISAPIITTSAAAISFAESVFLIPSEPCVSTLMRCPMTAAVFFRASAAIIVCAIPVGQAVTAIIFAMIFYHRFHG